MKALEVGKTISKEAGKVAAIALSVVIAIEVVENHFYVWKKRKEENKKIKEA